jgi:hypothetical protein
MAKATKVNQQAALTRARKIIRGMKWKISNEPQMFSIDGYEFNISDIAKFKRVEVLKNDCWEQAADDKIYLSNGNNIELFPALLIPQEEYFEDHVYSEKELFYCLSIDESGGVVPHWESRITSERWEHFKLYPDGTLSIGCQRHPFDKWMRISRPFLCDRPDSKENTAALEQLLPMCREFLNTHTPPVSKPPMVYSLNEIKEMLSARYREPAATKRVRKTTKKK